MITAGPPGGTFTIQVDEGGTVRVTMSGIWTVETAAQYLTAIRLARQQCRKAHGRIKELTDGREMPIQSQEVTAVINGAMGFLPGDRVAVIVATVLAKVATRGHMERRRAEGDFPEGCAREVFTSFLAAEAWLQA